MAVVMFLAACTSSSGLLLKESTLKQMELESFEGKSTLAVDIDTTSMNQSFEVEMDTKQVDLLNSVVDFQVGTDLLALLGLHVEPTNDGSVTLSMISKDGESIITSSEDDIGIQLSDISAEEEFGIGNEEEYVEFLTSFQDILHQLMEDYLENYDFSLNHIESHGEVLIDLPNGESMNTEHIEVELSGAEILDMLHYSLSHFLENEELQEQFFKEFSNLQLLMLDFVNMNEEISEEEIQEELQMIETELTSAIEELVITLEEFQSEHVAENEDMLNDFASVSLDTYIGVDDTETYQMEYATEFTFTEELADLILEDTNEPLPFSIGDSITLSSKDQIWNHNQDVGPIEVPDELITPDMLMELESVEDFKEIAGEDALFSQIAEQLAPLFEAGEFGFIELKVNENKAETIEGEVDTHLYIDDGQLMAPLALVSEQLGADVQWLEETRQIIVDNHNNVLEIDVQSRSDNTVKLNGEVSHDIHVEVIDGTSYVNVRNYAESMGWTVMWMDETHSAVVLP